MNHDTEDRLSGGLILAAVLAALVLMLHHPTSFKGPDDGLLLADWSNTVVHGAMMACLFLLRFAFGSWARRLGMEHASVRAGSLAFDCGMAAFIAAALVSGFAAGGLLAQAGYSDEVRSALAALGALNRALANLGMALTVAAMALWAIRMMRMSGLPRIAGALGLAIAAAALGWLVVRQGAFGLYPAMTSTVLFGAWSILVASRMMGGQPKETDQ
ncbi:hypothetical protein [Brevundimonas sp.]|jgi:hypothetical protein|uniref:hypothetical protein n=1 Tax=Brevundimonas sp. TaxID=1871086 RepID=UPI0037BF041E